MSKLKYLFPFMLMVILLSGCSTFESSLTPPEAPVPNQDDRHMLLGGWALRIDPSGPSITATQLRIGQAHFQVTSFILPPECSDCFSIELLSYKPALRIITVKVSLRNPSALTAYDVRGIMMTEDARIELLNADSYTTLWDNGGVININPFKAFATNIASREFAPGKSHARVYEILFAELASAVDLFLLIDASWPENCREPYEIRTPAAPIEFMDFNTHDIRCEVFSWGDDIESVSIDLTCLGYISEVSMIPDGGDWWVAQDVAWRPVGKVPGEYDALVSAKCVESGTSIYNYVHIRVSSSENGPGWTRTWGGNQPDAAQGVDVDQAGNIYITGDFTHVVDFDPSSGEFTLESNAGKDVYLTSYDPTGNFRWAVGFGGIEDETGNCVVASGGNVFIGGSFIGLVDFDPGVSVLEITANGWRDAFLSAFDSDGNFLWVRTWGGDDSLYYDFAHGICADPDGNIYVTGKFNGVADLDTGDGVDIHVAHGDTDAYLVKYLPNGDFLWARTWGGPDLNKGRDVAWTPDGRLSVGGIFRGEVVFNPDDTGESVISNGDYDFFLSSFTASGNYLGTRTFGGPLDDQCYSVTCLSNGSSVLTGYFQGTVDFDPGAGVDERTSKGGRDIFLIAFAPGGSVDWCRTWGGIGQVDTGLGVATGTDDEIYLTGTFSGSMDHDPTVGKYISTSTGFGNVFLSRFDSGGKLTWVRTFGGENPGFADFSYSVVAGFPNSVLLVGGYLGNTDFDPGPGVMELPGHGLYDAFLSVVGKAGNY